MKIKQIGKGIVVAVSMGLVVITATPSAVLANVPEQVQPMTEYILKNSASLTISSNGVATVKASVTPSGNYTTSVVATLQKKTSSGWENVKSWKAEGKGASTSVSATYSVSKGTYRVYATVKAGSETKHPTSESITY